MKENELDESIKGIESEIKNKKQIPEENIKKINKKVAENIIIADVVMLFLYFISLGSLNIDSNVLIADLKVFSIGLIIFTVFIFEYSYRNDSGNICVHGIECLVLSIFILISTYLYTIYIKNYHMIVASVSFLFAIYYVGKSIMIYIKMRKQYINESSEIRKIIER